MATVAGNQNLVEKVDALEAMINNYRQGQWDDTSQLTTRREEGSPTNVSPTHSYGQSHPTSANPPKKVQFVPYGSTENSTSSLGSGSLKDTQNSSRVLKLDVSTATSKSSPSKNKVPTSAEFCAKSAVSLAPNVNPAGRAKADLQRPNFIQNSQVSTQQQALTRIDSQKLGNLGQSVKVPDQSNTESQFPNSLDMDIKTDRNVKSGASNGQVVSKPAGSPSSGFQKPVVQRKRVNPEMTAVRPENLDTTNIRSADYYFNLVNYQCDDADNVKDSSDHVTKSPSNSRLISIMHTKERPHPKLYLFKFHASVSQATIDGRKSTTTACAVICMYFAKAFVRHPTVFPTEGGIRTLPAQIFQQVERAIRDGNQAHELNYKGKTVNLGPEEVILLTSHLGIEHAYETDIDTRDLETVLPAVMSLTGNQSIMFIKNSRVVSLVPCNDNEALLLFDSHPHFVITSEVRKVYGAYLFYAQKEEDVIRQLFHFYDAFCDPAPFYGKMVVFNM